MTVADLFAAIAAVAGVGAAVYAKRAVDRARDVAAIAEGALRYQVLMPLWQEYRSPAMLYAIRSLRSFARDHGPDLAAAYGKRLEQDEGVIQSLEPTKRVEYLATTLDNHRRMISHLYQLLGALYEEGGHLRRLIYTHWTRSDLQIIPKVLVPLELALGVETNDPASRVLLDRMRRLYDESPQ